MISNHHYIHDSFCEKRLFLSNRPIDESEIYSTPKSVLTSQANVVLPETERGPLLKGASIRCYGELLGRLLALFGKAQKLELGKEKSIYINKNSLKRYCFRWTKISGVSHQIFLSLEKVNMKDFPSGNVGEDLFKKGTLTLGDLPLLANAYIEPVKAPLHKNLVCLRTFWENRLYFCEPPAIKRKSLKAESESESESHFPCKGASVRSYGALTGLFLYTIGKAQKIEEEGNIFYLNKNSFTKFAARVQAASEYHGSPIWAYSMDKHYIPGPPAEISFSENIKEFLNKRSFSYAEVEKELFAFPQSGPNQNASLGVDPRSSFVSVFLG